MIITWYNNSDVGYIDDDFAQVSVEAEEVEIKKEESDEEESDEKE
jgi:hypothetical protein